MDGFRGGGSDVRDQVSPDPGVCLESEGRLGKKAEKRSQSKMNESFKNSMTLTQTFIICRKIRFLLFPSVGAERLSTVGGPLLGYNTQNVYNFWYVNKHLYLDIIKTC